MTEIKPRQDNSPLNWSHPLALDLQESATHLDFFQAVRRIECLAADLPRVGHARQAKHEAVRIGQSVALDFAPTTIDRIENTADGRALVSQRF